MRSLTLVGAFRSLSLAHFRAIATWMHLTRFKFSLLLTLAVYALYPVRRSISLLLSSVCPGATAAAEKKCAMELKATSTNLN